MPAIRATISLQRNNPAQAVEILQTTNARELAFPDMLTAYIRGKAFLRIHEGKRAALEYAKFTELALMAETVQTRTQFRWRSLRDAPFRASILAILWHDRLMKIAIKITLETEDGQHVQEIACWVRTSIGRMTLA